MKRYYLSPLAGSGTKLDPYRAKLADYTAQAASSVIPTDQLTGLPTANWCLCIVDRDDHTGLLADNALADLPDITLDTRIATLSNSVKNRMQSALTKFGLDPGLVNSSETFRDLIRSLGQSLEPSFSENNFNARLV